MSADIVNPVTVMVIEADIAALEWVKENTPEDARFFINTSYWQTDIYRGVDGGGWLLPYAGRWALVPTVFYTFSPDLAQGSELRGLGKSASEINSCSPQFWQLIKSADIEWLYIHQGQGALQPSTLLACEQLSLAYENDQVWIFHVTE